MLSQVFTAVLGLAALASAAPASEVSALEARAFSCSSPKGGLAKADCEYLSNIGFKGQGENPTSSGAQIWIGNNGPNVFTFTNKATVDVIAVLWDNSNGFASSFITAHPPKLTLSIAKGKSVQVSLANGITGAYSAIYNRKTPVSANGQVYNTWGEFTTGAHATINISRLPNMAGNKFAARVSTGCVADNDHCSYVCKSGNTCWESGSYSLIGCSSQKNNNAWLGGANPEGGCAGWDNGSGKITAEFL